MGRLAVRSVGWMMAAFRPVTLAGLSDEDESLLRRLVSWSSMHDPEGEKFSFRPFQDMLDRNIPLNDKQRAWARGLADRFLGEITYENLASSGRVCVGRPVATPAVLQNLPKRPPGRR